MGVQCVELFPIDSSTDEPWAKDYDGPPKSQALEYTRESVPSMKVAIRYITNDLGPRPKAAQATKQGNAHRIILRSL